MFARIPEEYPFRMHCAGAEAEDLEADAIAVMCEIVRYINDSVIYRCSYV